MVSCFLVGMRMTLAVMGLMALNCGVPDSDLCARATCQTGWHCSAPGGVVQCDPDVVPSQGGGAGGGTGSGAGGGTGTGGGGGGGVPVMEPAKPARVFVTLKYDYKTCCDLPYPQVCWCAQCSVTRCVLTQEMDVADLNASRVAAYSSCQVSQTSSDGYTVQCAQCVEADGTCSVKGGPAQYDRKATCSGKAGPLACAWFQ